MAKVRRISIRNYRISIRNYKGIENLELELPGSCMKDDPDVMVIGSQNGLGKTSIPERCSLLLSTLTTSQKQWQVWIPERRAWPVNWPDLLVRAGAEQIELDGEISVGRLEFSVSYHLTRRGRVQIHGEGLKEARQVFDATGEREGGGEELISAISGISTDPVLTDSFVTR
ncbi:MAG: ATP-binding protein [Synechococcus sp. SB0673_bin_10]|nr:ATP-binding protein [Synechococcus sp. SB0673_bin_10]